MGAQAGMGKQEFVFTSGRRLQVLKILRLGGAGQTDLGREFQFLETLRIKDLEK